MRDLFLSWISIRLETKRSMQVASKKGQHPLLVLQWVCSEGTNMATTGGNPFLFGLTGSGKELTFTRERCGSILIIGRMDEHNRTRRNLAHRVQWTHTIQIGSNQCVDQGGTVGQQR